MSEVRIKPIGDTGVTVVFGNAISSQVNGRVLALEEKLRGREGEGIVETVPAFSSLLVYYDPLILEYENVIHMIDALVDERDGTDSVRGKTVEIPVCYGSEYGMDLGFVAEHSGLSEDEVIRIHSGRDYRIYMVGFLPGFPYLGGLDERLYTPRLSNPRMRIPAGSVGIGGEQTGIYPLDSPGGWRLIGRTPLKLYDPLQEGEMLFQAGDSIRFIPVDSREFKALAAKSQ